MAAITFTDGTKLNVNGATSEIDLLCWRSPSTADSADTVVLPTIAGMTPFVAWAWDLTTGDSATATLSTQTVTLDAAGGTTNHVYLLFYGYAKT